MQLSLCGTILKRWTLKPASVHRHRDSRSRANFSSSRLELSVRLISSCETSRLFRYLTGKLSVHAFRSMAISSRSSSKARSAETESSCRDIWIRVLVQLSRVLFASATLSMATDRRVGASSSKMPAIRICSVGSQNYQVFPARSCEA